MSDDNEKIDEAFQQYRNSAVALAVILIAISGSAILAVREISGLSAVTKGVFIGLYGLIILLAVVMQLLHFVGYSNFAQHKFSKWVVVSGESILSEHSHKMPEDTVQRINKAQEANRSELNARKKQSDRAFGILDTLTWVTTVLFLMVTLVFISFLMNAQS